MRRTYATLVIVFFALALVMTSAGPTAAENGSCGPTKMRVRTADAQIDNYSTIWNDAPGMSQSFTLEGTKNRCVLVELTASAYSSGNPFYVRAVLDGGTVGSPSVVLFSSSMFTSQAMTFVFFNVASGSHVVQIQWSNLYNTQSSFAGRSLVVLY